MTTFLFISTLVLLFGSIEVYVALALSSTLAIALFTPIPLEIIAQRMFAGIDKFSLMAVPFFILAANVMKGGGISYRILNFIQATVGHKRGGLAMTVVLSCMFFWGGSFRLVSSNCSCNWRTNVSRNGRGWLR